MRITLRKVAFNSKRRRVTELARGKDMPLKEVLTLDTCAAGAANDELLKLVEKREAPPDQRLAVESLRMRRVLSSAWAPRLTR